MKLMILCGSVTNALKCKDALSGAGIHASLSKAPSQITAGYGCLYTLNVSASTEALSKALKEKRIRPNRVFAAAPDGRFMEVAL